MSTRPEFPTPPPNAVSFAFRLPDGDVGQMGWMSLTLYPAASKLIRLEPDVQVVFAVPEESLPPREVQAVDRVFIEKVAEYAWMHASWDWAAVKAGLDRFTTPQDSVVAQGVSNDAVVRAPVAFPQGVDPEQLASLEQRARGLWRALRICAAIDTSAYVDGLAISLITAELAAPKISGIRELQSNRGPQQATQQDGASVLRWAADVLDMWEGDPNETGYMGDFNDAQQILHLLADHAAPQDTAGLEDTRRMNWLATHPRGAQLVVNGEDKPKPCVFWGVSAAPGTTMRGAIDAAMAAEAKSGEA